MGKRSAYFFNCKSFWLGGRRRSHAGQQSPPRRQETGRNRRRLENMWIPDRVTITALHIPNVISGNMRKLGDEGARKGASSSVIDTAKMAANHLEKGEIGPCVGLKWIVDDVVEEREEGCDRDCSQYT
jgi:hypothetical protein